MAISPASPAWCVARQHSPRRQHQGCPAALEPCRDSRRLLFDRDIHFLWDQHCGNPQIRRRLSLPNTLEHIAPVIVPVPQEVADDRLRELRSRANRSPDWIANLSRLDRRLQIPVLWPQRILSFLKFVFHLSNYLFAVSVVRTLSRNSHNTNENCCTCALCE
jgi:hypothetical protein